MDTFNQYDPEEQPQSPFQPEANPFPEADFEPAPVDPVPEYAPVQQYVNPQPQSEPYRYVPSRNSQEAHAPQEDDFHHEAYTAREAYAPQEAYTAPEAKRPRKKESPFANSPYVMQTPQENTTYRYQPQPPQPKQPKVRKHTGIGRRILAAVLTLALVAAGCCITAFTVNNRWAVQNAQTMAQVNQRFQELEQQLQKAQEQAASAPAALPGGSVSVGDALTPAQVYAMNVRSVVAISATVESYAYGQVQEGASSGSGFILTEDGFVVTNYHVVEGATSLSVIMNDDTELAAKLVGYDSANDLAVLKVEATNLPAVKLGSSNALTVGDMVVAIGNPLGELNSTQTVGYICGKDREVTTGGTVINMLQTDAAINPGNSGGPLFNMKGEVVGITTAKYSGTTSSGASIEGIGFAIPIDDVLGIIGDLQTYGYVTGAYLGVTVQNLDAAFNDTYGFSGVYVVSVEPGYAAARAGIQPKDIIVALDGAKMSSVTDLTRGLRAYKAGDSVVISLIRSGIQMDVTVVLDEKPGNVQPNVPDDYGMPSEGDYDEWYEYFRRRFGDG